MSKHKLTPFFAFLLCLFFSGTCSLSAASRSKHKAANTAASHRSSHRVAVRTSSNRHQPASHLARLARTRRRHAIPVDNWTQPTFADSTAGDLVDGEDLVVRRSAVEALGPFNGSIVVADPSNGRLLAVVNQKLAYKGGFQPCSTIKLVAALAGLNENVIDSGTLVRIGRRRSMDLTDALAHSNNMFFANVGVRLGFEKVLQYAKLFGLGEKAALNIPEEEPVPLPKEPPASGLGMMTSFGEGFNFSPLQLASLVSAISNGGMMYYLQHPHSETEAGQLVPRVKRQLAIERWLPSIKPGMMGAVEYGTARRASYDQDQTILGKTGTCTDVRSPIHLGWFGSYNDIGSKKLVVVVLLTGGGRVNGPVAAGVAGSVYRNLQHEGYFGQTSAQSATTSPLALVSTQSCCR